MRRPILLAALSAALVSATAGAQTKLLRFPDIHENTLVFCYGGDLWRAPADGGTAIRLTAHPGQELFPKLSPDGAWIAFTGQYDGDEQVYVMPSGGGEPKRLTYYPAHGPLTPRWGYDNQVYGWTPDGRKILFRSMRDADSISVDSALYTVSPEGGLPVKLPMPSAGAGDYSPDGKRLVYSPLFRDFRTWKRYQGGWAQDLYIFDLASHEARPIAPSVRTERDPMWIGNTLYFVSDRDGTLNLYAYDLASDAVRQLTHSATWDVRWASSDNARRIVYELDGELQVFDTSTGQDRRVAIQVPDDGLARRPSHISVAENVEDFSLSPKGERALFVARGDIFTVPIEKGPSRNLTRTSGAHDKWARWSPDGARIAFISDAPGEDQVFVVDQRGTGKAEQLTTDFAAMLYWPEWSPDGARLAVSDKDGRLYALKLDDRKVVEVADDAYGEIEDYAWSPDGAHLAFSQANRNRTRSLYVWSVAGATLHRVTDDLFSAYSPVWDPEGRYLYFLSDRQFAPQISAVEWNFAGNRMTGIFALTLRRDVPNPFAPESDEVTLGDEEAKDEKHEKTTEQDKQKDEKKEPPKPVVIDFDGLAGRLVRVPVEADNIGGLAATSELVLYATAGAPFYGRKNPDRPKLRVLSLEERKSSVLADDIQGWALSRDGKKALVQDEKGYRLLEVRAEKKDAPAPPAAEAKVVSLSELAVDRVPAEEWEEIFDEVWRRFRDFFYVRNMHGYDWQAIGTRYRALVEHVAHRSDLNYVLGEMVAELNVGHAYIEGGDFEIPKRAPVGLPGARFELDEAAGRYRIATIFTGHNAEEKYRSPLTEVGVDAKVGDYVLAIDGEELKGSDNPYRLLQNKTNPVTLKLNSKPSLDGAREVTYLPVASEGSLIYLDRVERNRQAVSKATDGRVGYLHIPDMGAEGIYEFIKWFYPQVKTEGLVVDVRSNGGGNVSQWIIERLDNRLLGTRFGYDSDEPGTYPGVVHHGHKVCLISETSASDGDIFPYYFRKAGLGPLIGKRTWGGVVGISDTGPLIDGGTVYVPRNATNSEQGDWIIEGHGVDPDIEVDNDPASVIAGHDPQLERGIQEVLKAMAEHPMALPKRPPDPVKTE